MTMTKIASSLTTVTNAMSMMKHLSLLELLLLLFLFLFLSPQMLLLPPLMPGCSF